MKLLAMSDLHLEFSDLQVPADVSFDVAVLAGDIVCPGSAAIAWAQGPQALQRARAVVVVPGNHEYYDRVMPEERALMQRLGADSVTAGACPVHVLDCDAVVIDGVRFLGCTLWTDFELRIDTPEGLASDVDRGMAAARKSMVDYRTISVPTDGPASTAHVPGGASPEAGGASSEVGSASRQPSCASPVHGRPATRKLTAEDTLALHRAHRAWLAAALDQPFDGPTVVVTHHGPHRGSLASAFAADWASTAFISELPKSFFDVPVLWIHGHTHTSFDYRVGACRVLCNPRGYQRRSRAVPENLRFDPGLVVDVE